MANIFTIKGKKATQSVYLAHAAYENAKALVSAHNGKIDSDDGKMIQATFKTNKDAKAFADAFESAYAKAHKAYEKANGKSVKAKAEPTKSAPAPAKGKSNLVTVTLDGITYQVDKANLVPTAPKSAPAKKSAPKRAKGNGFDFSKIKGNSNADKNKALHATLVSMGMKDSRTAEYLAIWNARPWAK